jgi:hypothetical protein
VAGSVALVAGGWWLVEEVVGENFRLGFWPIRVLFAGFGKDLVLMATA